MYEVRRRLKLWLFSNNHSHGFLRGIALSIIFTVYTVTITAYIMVKEAIQRGELPWLTADAIIVGVSFLESMVAPAIAWVGWWRRRTTMMVWMVPTAVITFLFFAIPSATSSNSTEFCKAVSDFSTPGINSSSIAGLVLLLIMGLVVSLTMTATLCHGIGYMAEHKLEGLFLPFGVLVLARVMVILMFSKVLDSGMNTWILVLAVCGPVIVHLVQMLKVPETAPPTEGIQPPPEEGRDIFQSVGRVVSNKKSMTLIFAMAFSAAALWGFAYHENDVVKVKYLQAYSRDFISTQADILRYNLGIAFVLVTAMKFAPPLMPSYADRPVLKISSILAALAVPIYLAAALLYCKHGDVAGLLAAEYAQPNCSMQCSCDPTMNTFAPVCVVDQMTTYLSPCHAGCGSSLEAGGLKYLTDCACASGQRRAIYGACNESACRDTFEFHKLLFLIVSLLTVVILQLLGVAVIRAVDTRDRSVVVGVMISVTSFVVFVVGHSIFFVIGANTCVWFEAGSCQLHSSGFSYLIGGIAGVFALIAAIISIFVYFFLSNCKPQKDSSETGEIAM